MTIENPFTKTYIEFHLLQSFPVTCLNRDDVGAPKTAVVGGTTRARVSSQCWKRQVRLSMHEFGIKLGIRTKKVAEYIAKACEELGAPEDKAKDCSEVVAKALTKDTLHFFTEMEARAFAEYCKENDFDSSSIKPKEVYKKSKKIINSSLDGLDIALFGRMVAQAAELNIDAAASFSHAISTHKVSNEVEFFTALDDLQVEPGSAHMGSLEFNSATYYRYISLNLGQLWDNLVGEGVTKAIEVFTKALFTAVPAARQSTQSGASAWEYGKILVRKGQRLQMPFETPVLPDRKGGYLQKSIDTLKDYLAKKEQLAGSLFGKIADYEFGQDATFSIDHLIEALQDSVNQLQQKQVAA